MSDERTFLHDLNNKIAIIDGRINILLKKLRAENHSDFTMDEVIKRLDKINLTLKETEDLTKHRRSYLLELEDNEQNQRGA